MSHSIHEITQWISAHSPTTVAALTGAGISAESGIPTFRGIGGLWENLRPEELATPEAFARDPKTVWRWYEWRRSLVREAAPNAAHLALAGLEQDLPARGGVTVITQNVDELHRRAGSSAILELHGSIFRVRCIREGTVSPAPDAFDEIPPRCRCGALLRPDVVWFGEPLPEQTLASAVDVVSRADILLIIGTSGIVYPAAGLAGVLRHGISVEINPQATPLTDSCNFSIASPAAVIVPRICDAIAGSAR